MTISYDIYKFAWQNRLYMSKTILFLVRISILKLNNLTVLFGLSFTIYIIKSYNIFTITRVMNVCILQMTNEGFSWEEKKI